MSEDKPRYFVAKPQKGGHDLHYWQPSAALKRAGYKTVPLSRDKAAAIREAEALNAKVDQWRGGQPVLAVNRHGTVPWIVDAYKQSPKWARLRAASIQTYESYFGVITRWSAQRGDPPMRTVTKRDAGQFWTSIQRRTPTRAAMTIKICSLLWNYAIDLDEDVVTRNPFRNLGLPGLPSRSQVWKPEQITKVCETAIAMGYPSMALATILAINTAQRPSDILALRWIQYDGHVITLTQIKTGAKVTIPVTEQLKVALDDAKRRSTEGPVVSIAANGDRPVVLNDKKGRRWAAVGLFSCLFRRIARAAGIPDDMQFRDLRRTATTHLAEAGCTLHEISAIGGWPIATVAKMMSVYGKVNLAMAEGAILKLEQYRSRQK